MSLSYKLDSSEYKWWANLTSWLSIQNDTIKQGSAITDTFGDLVLRWNGLAPKGEYIIRDGYYHNGYYILVGSYSCRVQIYNSTATPVVGPFFFDAWDGFILICRGHSMFNRRNPARPISISTGDQLGPASEVPDAASYTFIPMRMPMIGSLCTPPSGPTTFDLLDESAQGLYGVIPMKSEDTVTIANSPIQENITIQVCGYHNMRNDIGYDASIYALDGAESKPYYAYLNFTAFQQAADTDNGTIIYEWDVEASIESCWTGAQAQSDLQTGTYGAFGIVREIDEMAIVENMCAVSDDYTWDRYLEGRLPDGTNPSGGGPVGSDQQAFSNGYAPSKFLGFNDFSEFYISSTGVTLPGTHNLFAGETYVWDNTDPAGAVTATYPFVLYQRMPPFVIEEMEGAVVPFTYLGPYFLGLPAYKSPNLVANNDADLGFKMMDSTPTRAVPFFEGAVAVDVLPPSESIRFNSADNEFSTLAIIALNNFLDEPGGNRESGFFVLRPYDFVTTTVVAIPYALSGTQFVSATSISMPTEVASTAVQYRTFTVDEENISKNTLGQGNKPVPNAFSMTDLDTGEYVGFIGNFWRFPTFPTSDPDVQTPPAAGTASRFGLGFGGGIDASGPFQMTYDTNYNAPTLTGVFPGPYEVNQQGILINAGADIDGIIASGTALDRSVVCCRWDNDRDQWLLTTTDAANGWSVVSVDSTWSEYLDQTTNFNPPAAVDAATYFPITMSNSLDGLVVWGTAQTETTGMVGFRSSTPTTFTSYSWGPGDIDTFNYATDSQFYAVRIDGTTGRSARVWIDYMLYDGVDSVIALQLREWGMRVTVENVEWFKARILRDGDLKAKGEEIEEWMDEQGKEYREMMKEKERSGRLRRRRSQVSAYKREVGDLMTRDQLDTQVYDFVPQGIAAQQRLKDSEGALKEVPPDSIEAMVERDYRAGFDTTPSGLTEPGDEPAEDPSKPAGTFMDTGDAPEKQPGEGGDPDEEYISED